MKKFFLILTTIIIASCSFDDKENNDNTLYQAYGVIKEDSNTSGKLYVRSDDGKVILSSQSNFLSNENRDDRVWMTFSVTNDVNLDTIKVNVYDFLIITQIDFKIQNDNYEAQPNVSVSDNVDLNNMWIAQDYLTLEMAVKASSETSLKNHKYTMFLNEKSSNSIEEVSDTVHLEFKYERNNDADTQLFTKAVALKLDDKINAKVLIVKYMTVTGIKEKIVTYTK